MLFTIESMTCGGCARSVVKAVKGVDPVAEVEADPATRRVAVTSTRPVAEIVTALAEAGYPAVPRKVPATALGA
jgi:copper chaperone